MHKISIVMKCYECVCTYRTINTSLNFALRNQQKTRKERKYPISGNNNAVKMPEKPHIIFEGHKKPVYELFDLLYIIYIRSNIYSMSHTYTAVAFTTTHMIFRGFQVNSIQFIEQIFQTMLQIIREYDSPRCFHLYKKWPWIFVCHFHIFSFPIHIKIALHWITGYLLNCIFFLDIKTKQKMCRLLFCVNSFFFYLAMTTND